MPRSTLIVRVFVALLASLALGYIWIIVSAKLEIGGASPNQQRLGTLPGVRPHAVSQDCTGVKVTAQGTWLVGRVTNEYEQLEPSSERVDLNGLLDGELRPEPETTVVARLGVDGVFKQVAQVSGSACLVASAEGTRVFLLSSLYRPNDAGGQNAVFRSDDQGKTWRWVADGFFPEVSGVATLVSPYFYNQDEVWASRWADDVEPLAGVYYSADGGAHSTPITVPQPLAVTQDYAHSLRPDIQEWRDSTEQLTHVWQQDAQHAVIWVSQRFWGSHPDGKSDNLAIGVTTRVQLKRTADTWQVEDIQRENGLYISELADNGAGRVIGLIDQGPHGRAVVAELNTATLAWKTVGDLPSVFSPLSADTQARGLWVGRNSLVVNTYSDHKPPRWLYWWSEASISADAVFYSTDWGHSWKRLSLDGYMGVRGFDGASDRVFWSKQNYADDTLIHAYGLR
ncbi:hypothetical protein RJC98_18890 [Pseudomonas allii]|uniref:Uncharacterized protein n=1 Tax=Pseudomonas allii TaxID=2740531 RepID=A0ACC6LG23_9PSED|nr:hypothetical protein [Pseudomonas allii]MDR9877253.1 hypothetical protein [Pseudomonas allii]